MSKTKIPPNPILSERIRLMRTIQTPKMTQEQLGEEIGVTEQTIRKYESGKYGIPKAIVECLADRLGCCSEYLYGITECITKEEYQSEKAELQSLIKKSNEYLNEVSRQWKLTEDFLTTFLGFTVKHSYRKDPDGSILPVVRITDCNNNTFDFDSKKDTEHFLMCFYDDVKKLLRYHLLDYDARCNK